MTSTRPIPDDRPELLHPEEPYEVDPAQRTFVSYIDKSREFYAAQGYERPYRWARHEDAPFARPAKPLAECRVGLVTTSTLLDGWAPGDPAPDPEELPAPKVYAAPMEPPPERLYTWNRSWDKEATHTEDLDSFFPVHRLEELVGAGRIGGLSPRFYGVPTEYSQRRTREVDAPEVLRLLREDEVDAAVLVPL
jgi:D-proline reductase (dithiol) PrdB